MPRLAGLELNTNLISVVNSGSFGGLNKVTRISLGYNKIVHVKGALFKDAANLQYLSLNNNKIKTLPADSFKGLYNLRQLSLQANNIISIEEGTFKDTKFLYRIILSNNKIWSLEAGVFDGLPNLFSLYLEENKIPIITIGSFEGLTSLRYWNVQVCNLTVIDPDLFKDVIKLRRLKLDINNIVTIHNGTFRNLKDLFSLSFMSNKIEVIESGAFKGLHSLKYLFLEYNRIKSLDGGLFNETTSLIHLWLTRNRIESFSAIQGIATLEDLGLSDNRITTLQPGIFKGLSSLERLALEINKISSLSPNTFQELHNLQHLSLAQNEIRNISKDAFQDSKTLESISFWKNRLSSIPNGTLQGLDDLQHVILQDNQLSLLPDCSGAQIKQLFVVNNKINALPPMALKSAKDLIVLLLDNNNLERVQNHSFYGAFKLKTITLSRNPIKVVEEGAFLSLPSLETVNLLDTEIVAPLKIWPMAINVTYHVSRAIESTFTIELVKAKYEDHARIFLSSLGYICRWKFLLTMCKPCNRGTFKSKVQNICEVCPAGGFYQDEMAYVGATSYGLGCKQCPPGTYVKPEMVPGRSQTDCQSCPQGTDFKEVAKFHACKCLKNYYRLDRFGPCTFCTKGYVCEKENVDLAAGFFWVWESRKYQENYEIFQKDLKLQSSTYKQRAFQGVIPQAYACPLAESCLGGILSKCEVGYTGPLCAICKKGYFAMMAKCRRCPSPPWIIAQIVLTLLAVGFIIFVILWGKKKRANDSSRSLTDIFLARLKIVIGFYQVSSSTFDSFSYISWPGPIVTMMRYAKIVQLNLLQIVPLHCLDNKITINAYSYFLMSITMTALIITFGFLAHFFLNYYQAAKRKDKNQVKQYKEKCYRFLFLILFITFPSTCDQIIKMLPVACHIICSNDGMNCKSYLRADYSIECNTARHAIYGALSIASLTYCIGFPIFIILVLKRGRLMERFSEKSLSHSVVIYSGIRFLYENYSPSCWFWEVVELVRKILFSSLLLLLNAESRISLGLTAIASGLYSVLFALHKPINDRFEHWLQLASLMVTSVNFTVGMLMKIPQEETSSGLSNESDSLIVTVLLVAANIAVVFIIAVKYAASIIQALIDLKKEPKCDVMCCLEILQVVGDAHVDISGVCTESSFMDGGLNNSSPEDVGVSAVEYEYTDVVNEEQSDDTNNVKDSNKTKNDIITTRF